MAVLFLVEIAEGKVKKASVEAASYASKYAATIGKEAIGLTLGSIEHAALAQLRVYDEKKIIHSENKAFDNFDTSAYAKAIADVAGTVSADTIIISQTLTG